MPLDVHKEIAETVKASYIEARNANEHEVRLNSSWFYIFIEADKITSLYREGLCHNV